MTTTALGTRVPARARTRIEIADRALELFAARGYAATSVNDISDAAGCSKATVLYHFESKAAILHEVLQPAARALRDLLDELAALPADQVRHRAIERIIDLVVRFRGLEVVLETLLSQAPELVEFRDDCYALPVMLAGGLDADPTEAAVAIFALSGLVAQCRSATLDDHELRAHLSLCLHRLLPSPQSTSTDRT